MASYAWHRKAFREGPVCGSINSPAMIGKCANGANAANDLCGGRKMEESTDYRITNADKLRAIIGEAS